VLALLTAVGLLATFWQMDFNLEGKGRLKPVTLSGVFAQIDGEIVDIPVAYNSEVQKGTELLTLRSYELQDQMAQLAGQAEGNETRLVGLRRQLGKEQLTEAERAELSGEIARLNSERRTIALQLQTLQKMLDLLTVRSPIAGHIITGKHQIEQLGNRPVSRGQMLLEVADLSGEWYLEVLMPESRMRHVSEAWAEATEKGEPLPVNFILVGLPDTTFTGTVDLVESTAEARGDEGNTVLLRVKLDADELMRLRTAIDGDPKVGAEAIAKVTCGKASAGYVYLHDLIDFVQAKVLFRLW
jgi:multidrug efflux pump subunit AcrA (membrane-fusion protein)